MSARSLHLAPRPRSTSGEIVSVGGESYYAIRNVDALEPFFISVVSADDHWLFVSSTGGLTAGRVSPETALFPYVTVDKIHESVTHTGPATILRAPGARGPQIWEPFRPERSGHFETTRNLYKTLVGDKLLFEELNHDLGLTFRYTWSSSETFGFVRRCELENSTLRPIAVDILDGLQNILPAGAPLLAQTNASNLVDAYKWSELDEATGQAVFTLYSAISDRAEPCESLRATSVFSLGLEAPQILLSAEQFSAFRQGEPVFSEERRRGSRGAYMVSQSIDIAAGAAQRWQFVVDLEKSQADVVELRRQLGDPRGVATAVAESVAAGTEELLRIVARGDGLQVTDQEEICAHHFSATLFNLLRGGTFRDRYALSVEHLRAALRHFNRAVENRHGNFFDRLPATVELGELRQQVAQLQDPQLERLVTEYLPLTFGRRHGDPSRPWNRFEIRLKDKAGLPLLAYQGNWRDVFQNWEALGFSYPEFVAGFIAKFVNASTADGYNPYRIDSGGFDWEVEEADDPWSNIGYWGDHQIIYLQKLLEIAEAFDPGSLRNLLRRPIFSFANVPYRIAAFEQLVANPKRTVSFDHALAAEIDNRVSRIGADGKLLLDDSGQVYQVNLFEKLLIPLLSKLGNFVVDGGIWLNTQRPEWNDANNALVGHGVSVVTLCYMRRYVAFVAELLEGETKSFAVSCEVGQWLDDTAAAVRRIRAKLARGHLDPTDRYAALAALGESASQYRHRVYEQGGLSGRGESEAESVRQFLADTLVVIDASIAANRRDDGLYHSYNLLNVSDGQLELDSLYRMLEGQVAALSAGALSAEAAADMVDALFDSDVYRPDQQSFMLYPDRHLPGFLQKNRIDERQLSNIPALVSMLNDGDERIVLRDADGAVRFNPDFANASLLAAELDKLIDDGSCSMASDDRDRVLALYEAVFNHRAFTGRSGTMFAYEGLGSVYWHMVSKLLLAIQENFFRALDEGVSHGIVRRLGEQYYRVSQGLGVNKSPAEFGAFPTDPYSHTPKHTGAKQPGMTGQVKEDMLCRYGELGVRVIAGAVEFRPNLLRAREFVATPREFRYLDTDDNWQIIAVPERGLAFTWCQVPILYRLVDPGDERLTVIDKEGHATVFESAALPQRFAAELFQRTGRIARLEMDIAQSSLFAA